MPIDPRTITWDNGPAQQAPRGRVFTLPQNPQQARDNSRQDRNDAVSQANEAERIRLERERVAMAQRQAAAEAAAKAQDARKQASDRNLELAPLRALDEQLRRTWDLYQQGPGSTQGISSLMDYLPTSTNQAFDTAGAGIGEMGRSAFRTTGVGSQSDKELEAFIAANQPNSSDNDAKIREKLSNIERRLGAFYKARGVAYKPYRPKGYTGDAPRKSKEIDFNDWGK